MPTPLPFNESNRLAALRACGILDTPPDRLFDDITKLAAFICDTPIALVSFVDEDRQWFKSRHGLAAIETERCLSFCAWAILEDELFEVKDTWLDDRFVDNGLVTGEPHIRFYAGAPLRSAEGMNLGTLCVIDRVPRSLSDRQGEALQALARQAGVVLEEGIVRRRLVEATNTLNAFDRSFGSCILCGDLVFSDGQRSLHDFVSVHTPARFHDTVCRTCPPVYDPEPSVAIEAFQELNR